MNDDVISRQAVIEELHRYFFVGFESDKYWNSTHVLQAIANVPSVPQKTGWWAGTVCTACGESTSDYYNCNYCPRCGAKMEGEL